MNGLKWIFLLIMTGSFIAAQEAVVVAIQSENRIIVQNNGKQYPIRLAGIASFATAGVRQAEVPWQTREAFSAKVREILEHRIAVGSVIHYAVIDDGDRGAEYVWLYDEELNYRLVREGYALVDSSDPYLPGQLEMRMKMAMAYARAHKLGFWKRPKEMAAMRVAPWYRSRSTEGQIQYIVEKNPQKSNLLTIKAKERDPKQFLALLESDQPFMPKVSNIKR